MNSSAPKILCESDDGYEVKFLDTSSLLQEFLEFKRAQRPSLSDDECYAAFAIAKFGISEPASATAALVTGQFTHPRLAKAYLAQVPNAPLKVHVEDDYDVRILDITPLEQAYAKSEKANPRSTRRKLLPALAVTELDGAIIDAPAMENIFSKSWIRPQTADFVFRKFPRLPFELKKINRGRRAQLSPMEDMRKHGAKFGFVPSGVLDDNLLVFAFDRLKRAGISVSAIQAISERDLESRTTDELHFVLNTTRHSSRLKPWPVFKPLYAVDPELIYVGSRASAKSELAGFHRERLVAVLSGSPESTFSESLPLHRFEHSNAAEEYEWLLKAIETGFYDAALFNEYSLHSVLSQLFDHGMAATFSTTFFLEPFRPSRRRLSIRKGEESAPTAPNKRKAVPLIFGLATRKSGEDIAELLGDVGHRAWRHFVDEVIERGSRPQPLSPAQLMRNSAFFKIQEDFFHQESCGPSGGRLA